MNEERREILRRVADGLLTPQEAAAELQELEPGPGTGAEGATATAAPPATTRVRVLASMGSVTVIGDQSVREAVAEGPHTARQEGDTLVVESTHEDGSGFVFGAGRVRFGFDNRERRLVIRVNPSLPLEVQCEAGSLRVEGVQAPIRASAHAGSLNILGFTHPIDLEVQAGSVKASGVITAGASRVRCHAGSVKLELDAESSVRISARSTLGRITMPDGQPITGILGGRTGSQLGAGVGTLEIESEMGSVSVSLAQ